MSEHAMPVDDLTLRDTWEEYRRAAKQSRQMKERVNRRRLISLGLVIAGALCGVLAAQIGDWTESGDSSAWLARSFAAASAAAVALVTYLGRDSLATGMEQGWVTARARAEALKSEAFKYLARVPPYDDADRRDQLRQKREDLLAGEVPSAIYPVVLSEEEKLANLPAEWLSPETYIQQRVDDQVEHYYRPRAVENYRSLSRTRTIGLLLGATGVVLGAIGATFADATWVAGWVAVVGTAGGALAAFAMANRLEYQALSYDAAARRLKSLVDAWDSQPESDKQAAFPRLVQDCERAIREESSNWVAEWMKPVATAAGSGQPRVD